VVARPGAVEAWDIFPGRFSSEGALPWTRRINFRSEDEWPVAGEVLSATGVPRAVAGLLQIRVRLPRDLAPDNTLTFSLEIRSVWEHPGKRCSRSRPKK
jgi:hypothetical protein